MYKEMPTTFNDVTVGNSTCTEVDCCGDQFGFLATEGWDTVSGMGTPNVGNMMAWLRRRT